MKESEVIVTEIGGAVGCWGYGYQSENGRAFVYSKHYLFIHVIKKLSSCNTCLPPSTARPQII